MKKKIIFAASFNIDPHWPNNPFQEARLTREWISYRLKIFMNYTCKSLRKQTNQDFLACIAYDPVSEAIVQEELAKYEKLPSNIIFTTNLYRNIVGAINGYDLFYYVRLDSDDMYAIDFVQQLHDWEYKEGNQILINQKGYIYEASTKRLGHFFNESPPFFTFVYKVEDYLAGKLYRLEKGHVGAIKLNHEILKEENFMVNIHEQNSGTKFDTRRFGELIINEEEKKRIFTRFGMEE